MEFMTKMRFILLGIAVFFVSFSSAEERSDYFSLENPYLDKIYYSEAYVKVPFLDSQKVGIYVVTRWRYAEVATFLYVNDKNDALIYMEPGIERNELTSDFYPCIDRHVKANIEHFARTCGPENLQVEKGLYEKLNRFLDENPWGLSFNSECRDFYETSVYRVNKDGSIKKTSFPNPHCLVDDLQNDVLVKAYFSIATDIEGIVDYKKAMKCNWRNLVKDPEKFSPDRYRAKNYLTVLTGKDCPAL